MPGILKLKGEKRSDPVSRRRHKHGRKEPKRISAEKEGKSTRGYPASGAKSLQTLRQAQNQKAGGERD